MNTERLVIITAKVHDSFTESLEKRGYAVLYLPLVTYDELLPMIGKAEGIIVTTRITIDKPATSVW